MAHKTAKERGLPPLPKGRPPGERNMLPLGVEAALKRLNEKKFRVRTDIPEDQQEDAAQLAAWARGRVIDVVRGACHSKKAPSYLKGATFLLEETTEPIMRAVKVEGISLAGAVAQVAQKIKDEK